MEILQLESNANISNSLRNILGSALEEVMEAMPIMSKWKIGKSKDDLHYLFGPLESESKEIEKQSASRIDGYLILSTTNAQGRRVRVVSSE